MKVLLMGSVVLLAGCAARAPENRTVRVEVPVQVPCRAKAVAESAFATAGLEVKMRTLLAERRQRIGQERELVMSQGCR